MSARRAVLLAVTAALAVVVLAPAESGGFGTVNNFGQRNEHERITRAALACGATAAPARCFETRSILSLAGGPGAFGGVGSPDSDEVFNPDAHCDDADYLPDTPDYPQTREQATAQLIACRSHLQGRFRQAVTAAAGMLDGRGRIIAAQVDLTKSCTFTGQFAGRAKCGVLEGLGRDLHGTEDFYSHSNWADQRDRTQPISPSNPPGLGRDGVPAFFDLRAADAPAIPQLLSTGCFSLVPFACRHRVDHGSLNKDKGLIDPVTGAASDPTTPRGEVGTNFARAVRGAIAEAQRQWDDLADELVNMYGGTEGDLMICAITHDDPVHACTGRRIALVIDSVGSDTLERRIGAARGLTDSLVGAAEATGGQAADEAAVIDAGDPARVVSSLGDPAAADFDAIHAQAASDLGNGISLGLDEVTGVPDGSGVVVFTDTLAGQGLDQALARADQLGIRVSVGVTEGAAASGARVSQAAAEPPSQTVAAVLATGGTFAVLDSTQAERAFLDQVERDGLTNAEDPGGAADGGALEPGVDAFAAETPGEAPERWSYHTRPGTRLVVALMDAKGLAARLEDVRTHRALDEARATAAGEARLTGRTESGEVELVLSGPGARGVYGVHVAEPMQDLRGGRGGDRLRCGRRSTYVTARGGADVATCRAGDDTLDGGAGADRLRAGGGRDVFVVRAGDLRRGVERLDGGPGRDVALFEFARPRGTRCHRGTTTRVPLGRRAVVVLRRIERVRFADRPCGAPALHERARRLHPAGFAPTLVPPEPAARFAGVAGRTLHLAVHVGEPTSVVVEGTAATGGRTFALAPVMLDATPGDHRVALLLPEQLERSPTVTLRLTVVTGGVREGPTRRDTVHAVLHR